MRIGTRAIRSRLTLSAISVLGACAHFWTPPPAVPVSMEARDSRRALLGDWRLALIVDSVFDVLDAEARKKNRT
mgnify:CR=1 FL=1